MPRFSDVFVYESRENMTGNLIGYRGCYMLKTLGTKNRGDKIEIIVFDIDGMFIMLHEHGEVIGPYCLTA